MSWLAIGRVGFQVLLQDAETAAYIAKTACHLVSIVYPAYDTFKSIEAKTTGDSQKRVQWLTYWCIHAGLTLFDDHLQKIPFFHHGKTIFVLWLISPRTQGALRLYRYCIRPLLLRFEPKVDAIIQYWSDTAGHYIDQAVAAVDSYILWFFEAPTKRTKKRAHRYDDEE